MAVKWVDLFAGLANGEIERAGSGLVVSTRFHRESKYAIFECTALASIKEIHRTGEDEVAFHTDGYKIYLVYEPARYPLGFQEPYLREIDQQIPLRFNELEIFELPNHDKVLMNREPYWSRGSVTMAAPAEGDFANFIFANGNLAKSAHEYVADILHDDFGVHGAPLARIMELFDRHMQNFSAGE